jgi:hypothetical protein
MRPEENTENDIFYSMLGYIYNKPCKLFWEHVVSFVVIYVRSLCPVEGMWQAEDTWQAGSMNYCQVENIWQAEIIWQAENI